MAIQGNLAVNRDRLWDSLEEMAKIGATAKGGCNRQTLTDLDGQGRRLFQQWCEAAGMTVGTDSMGDMFARREGADPALDPVAVGSHLDTQPTGGKYDGVLGVLAALELVRTLNDLEIETEHPIEIVNWTNEEGARFAPAMLASGVFAGVYEEAWAKTLTDRDGLVFGEELRRIGFEGPLPVGHRSFHAFFELHIEQGPILETEGIDIGIVTHAQGLCWLDVVVKGQDSHAGTTPMPRRQDAMVAAARMISAIEDIAQEHAPDAVGTVGYVSAAPGSRNVIPGQADFTVDLRHPKQDALDAMRGAFERRVSEIAAANGVVAEIAPVEAHEPVAFDEACLARLRSAAEALGLSHRDMISGAGHDACHIASVAPTAMIFCPCVDGLSHNEAEAITPDWAAAGANVLLRAAVETAGIVDR